MPAQVFTTGLRHRDDAAGRIHEALVHHHAGDEAVRHQVGLHLADGVEARVALRAIGRCGRSLFSRRPQVDPLHVVRHAGEAADPLLLDDLHRLANGHSLIGGLFATLAIDV